MNALTVEQRWMVIFKMGLINTNDLYKAMYHEAFEVDSYMQKWDSGCWIRFKLFENVLDGMPRVDAEPVKHGKWHKISNNQWGDIDGYQCSECGEECAFPDWVEDESDEDMCLTMMKYCYNCGARMDGDE